MIAARAVRTNHMNKVMCKTTGSTEDSKGVTQTEIEPPEDKGVQDLYPSGAQMKEGGTKMTWSANFPLSLLAEPEQGAVLRTLGDTAISFAGKTSITKATNNSGAEFEHPMMGITDAPRDQ